MRRIEALTGQAAIDHLKAQEARLASIAAALKAPVGEVTERVKALIDERKALANEVAQLRRDLAMSGGGKAEAASETVNGLTLTTQVLTGVSGKDLPPMIDEMKAAGNTGIMVLAAEGEGKVAVAVGAGSAAIGKVSAVDVLRVVIAALGGKGGGGRPDLAQGGAPSLESFDAAIAAARAVMEGK